MKARRFITDKTLLYCEKNLNREDRIMIAGMLDAIGVQEIVISAASKHELDAYRENVKNARLSLCVEMEPAKISEISGWGEAIHLQIPASYPMIYTTHKKNKDWVKKMLAECREILTDTDIPITVDLVDAARVEIRFLEMLVELSSGMVISKLCLIDTTGTQWLSSCAGLVSAAKQFGYDICYEGGDRLGMAVPNTIQALKSGASYAACRIAGMGGGCDLSNLLSAAHRLFSFNIDRKGVDELEQTIRNRL